MTIVTSPVLLKHVYGRLPGPWTAGTDLYLRHRHGGRRAPARLDVMTSLGGAEVDVLQVMLLSLAETHPRDRIEFWLLHLNIGPDKLADLQAFCETLPNLRLHLVQVPDREKFVLLSKLGGRPFGARFLWFVAHLHLPVDLERVIFLDPLDTLVTDDLVPFLNHPFAGRYIVACREVPSLPPVIIKPARAAQADGASNARILRASKGVMNSGAMVINLAKMRRDRIGFDHYIEVALWAGDRMGLTFGDQGLFSLTHGSHYLQAHDRNNFRFFSAPLQTPRMRPTVLHFAGNIPKPFHLRLSAQQEQQIFKRGQARDRGVVNLTPRQIISPAFFAHYRSWWATCARTPCFARIAPLADARTALTLANLPADPDPSSTVEAAVPANTAG